jgi:predicted dinucleotide-binding enzyme
MKIGVLGTGMVGHALATRFVELGHEVAMGSRDAANPKAVEWAQAAGEHASNGTFADAAGFGDVVVNATAGVASLDALRSAGADTLAGKVLLDVANPLDTSQGMPPTLAIANTDSLAEAIQREFPAARVVKALNTVNCSVMVQPSVVPGEHHVFVAGDDGDAKAVVLGLVGELGWPASSVIDLGGIRAARGMEMYLPLWVSLMQTLGTPAFNIRIVRS